MYRLTSRLPRVLGTAIFVATLALPWLPAGQAAAADDIKIDEIGRHKRGKENVTVRADVHDAGLTCQLKLKYPDGNADSPDDVKSNSKGICVLRFDVPDRKSAVGDAIAKLRVLDSSGNEIAKASRLFQVRDGRK